MDEGIIPVTLKKQSNMFIWGLIGAAAASVGGIFFLFNYFRKDLSLTEDQKIQIEEIRQEIEESNCEITTEAAKQIIALIDHIAMENFKSKSYIHEKRRSAIKNNIEYIKLCKETLNLKQSALSEATKKVLYYFGNISVEEIQKVLRKIPIYELEKVVKNSDSFLIQNSTPLDKNSIKEAYIFYAKRHGEMMNDNLSLIEHKSKQNNSITQEGLIEKILLIKIQIEDELYLKYKMNHSQLCYFLLEFNLMEDSDIKKLYEEVSSFNKILEANK
jgi:hypothetical protein